MSLLDTLLIHLFDYLKSQISKGLYTGDRSSKRSGVDIIDLQLFFAPGIKQ
jgi:hypothetical protein